MSAEHSDPGDKASEDDEARIAAILVQEQQILDEFHSLWDRYPSEEQEDALEEAQAPLKLRLGELRKERHAIEHRLRVAQETEEAVDEAEQQPQSDAIEETAAPEPLREAEEEPQPPEWLSGIDDEVPERDGALAYLLTMEPDRTKPYRALRSLGMTRRRGKEIGGHKLVIDEYEWRAGAWRRTARPRDFPTSLSRAIAMADGFGAPKPVGRKKPAFNMANYKKVEPLFSGGVPRREIARKTKISKGTVNRLYALWRDHGGEVAQ